MGDDNDGFTGNINNDITLLSSFLHRSQDPDCKVEPHDFKHSGLSLVTHISTLLSIPAKSPHPLNVNAVIGSIDSSSIQCFIFTDNQLDLEKTQGESEGAELFQLTTIESHSDHGDCAFNIHVRDVFNIITYLQKTPDPEEGLLLKFLLFAHYQAFRTVGLRILEFSQHWGSTPFQLMLAHADDIARCSDLQKVFTLPLDPPQCILLSKYHLHDTQSSASNILNDNPLSDREQVYTYIVEPSNLSSWLDLFIGLWQQLENQFLIPVLPNDNLSASLGISPPKSVRLESQELAKMEYICVFIGTLHTLQPVLKHLLSANENWKLHCSLEQAESDVAMVMDFMSRNGPGANVTSETQSNELHGGNESELTPEYYESPGARIIRSLKFFMHKRIEVHQLRYTPTGPVHFNSVQVRQVLKQINNVREWTESEVQELQMKTMFASVHAEAVLMGWASSSEAPVNIFNTLSSIPIGMSQKCCRLCWLLHKLLNNEGDVAPAFVLPGTHTTFYSWTPPPGVPHHILLQLCKDLLGVIKNKVGPTSRHSFSNWNRDLEKLGIRNQHLRVREN
ncbi:hypothetical protein GYMLUDRAFT_64928 [Collybiopsis luxurians FD-317 M1]|uniref:Uncharacterized protein n=1 Tax=Collybiopsis luxurians FD-317 M1 TaxID=944289 RepID=A0A0D0BAC8_9AGAR|nr:hypothetical protein GYMLUDRAFT_64928 [Collybiopsis luxurians FD-317 M1]